MSHLLSIALLLSVPAVDVNVTTRDGASVHGQLVSLSTDALVVKSDGNDATLTREQIQSVVFPEAKKGLTKPTGGVILTDQTTILCKEIVVNGQTAVVTLGDDKFSLPTKAIHYARFSSQNERMDAQWNEILKETISGDAIVIRRANMGLDYLEGVLGNIADGKFKFQFEDEWNDVDEAKVDGIVYYHATKTEFPNAICKLTTSSGSVFHVDSMSVEGDTAKMTLTNGVATTIRVSTIANINFASASIVYLSDLDAEAIDWQPVIPAEDLLDQMAELFKPTRDRNLLSQPLAIAMEPNSRSVREFAKGVSIQSRTEMTFRLDRQFRKFQTIAGIDRSMLPAGYVQLLIHGDNKELVNQIIKGDDAAKPLDVDVSGVRRLKITVDFGNDSDEGDRLDLCNARLTK